LSNTINPVSRDWLTILMLSIGRLRCDALLRHFPLDSHTSKNLDDVRRTGRSRRFNFTASHSTDTSKILMASMDGCSPLPIRTEVKLSRRWYLVPNPGE
jgi:hypothetical protein